MNKFFNILRDTCYICLQELKNVFRDQGVLIFLVVVPLAYPLLYSWIYNNEVAREVPVAIVDLSHSHTSREFTRMIDASPDTRVALRCNSLDEARQRIGRGDAYGVVYFPEDFQTKLNRMEQTHVGVYCDMSIMLAYKAIFQTCVAIQGELNSRIQVKLSGNYTERENEITTRPLDFQEVPIFNNTADMAISSSPECSCSSSSRRCSWVWEWRQERRGRRTTTDFSCLSTVATVA